MWCPPVAGTVPAGLAPRRATVVPLSTTNTYRRCRRVQLDRARGVRRASQCTVPRRSHVRFEMKGARHRDAAAEGRDPLAGYPGRVDDPAAGDDEARCGTWLAVAEVHAELAGQFVLGVLDPQVADSAPSGRHPHEQVGPEADLRAGPAVHETSPAH